MTTSWALSRSLERIGQLCRDVPDDKELRRGVLAELGRTVPFSAFAWPLSDPESATGTSPMARIPCPEELPALIRLKYLTPEGRWTALMGQVRPATTLLMATGGRPERSPLWNGLLVRYRVTDVLSTVFADKHGCWGWLDLWRSAEDGTFSEPETDYLATAAPLLAAGLRRSRAAQCRREAEGSGPAWQAVRKPLPPQAVLTLDEGLAVVGQTASASDWLGLLQRGPRPYEGIPAEVLNVAAQLLAREAGVDSHPAMARVPVGHGAWALLRSTRMERRAAGGIPSARGDHPGLPGGGPAGGVRPLLCPDPAAAPAPGPRRRRTEHGGARGNPADPPLHRAGPVQAHLCRLRRPEPERAAGTGPWHRGGAG